MSEVHIVWNIMFLDEIHRKAVTSCWPNMFWSEYISQKLFEFATSGRKPTRVDKKLISIKKYSNVFVYDLSLRQKKSICGNKALI